MVQSDERPKEGRDVTATAHEPISQADVLLEGFLAWTPRRASGRS